MSVEFSFRAPSAMIVLSFDVPIDQFRKDLAAAEAALDGDVAVQPYISPAMPQAMRDGADREEVRYRDLVARFVARIQRGD